jgi:crossover junction endodeoxyribonuclease RuvC
MIFLGIDPGNSGGFVLIDEDGNVLTHDKQPETELDVCFSLQCARNFAELEGHKLTAIIEKVHAMPKQGVTSVFTFGRNYGFLRGVITSLSIPFVDVTPQKWQKELGCQTKGDKNVSKAKAQQLWPKIKWTHATADAALIAKWGQLMHKQGKL